MASNFGAVIDSFVKHVIHKVHGEESTEELVLKNFIENQQREDIDEYEIYDAIAEMFPELGSPLDFYTEIIVPMDDVYKDAMKAQKAVEKEAENASKQVSREFSDKQKCLELERKTRNAESTVSAVTTALMSPTLNSTFLDIQLKVGDYVQVEPDLSPYNYSHGGTGYVAAVTTKEPGETSYSVKYDEFAPSRGTEKEVPLRRLTEKVSPLYQASSGGSQSSKRKRSSPVPFHIAPVVLDDRLRHRPIHEVLQEGHERNRRKGWRARDKGYSTISKSIIASDSTFRKLVAHDTLELKGFLAAEPTANRNIKRASNGHFKENAKTFPAVALSMNNLAFAWGLGRKTPGKILEAERAGTTL
jgi:hypothetical protein